MGLKTDSLEPYLFFGSLKKHSNLIQSLFDVKLVAVQKPFFDPNWAIQPLVQGTWVQNFEFIELLTL